MDLFKEKYVPVKRYVDYLNSIYGSSWLDFDPETIWLDVRDRLGYDPIDIVKNKINAVKMLLKTELFYTNNRIFEKVILALNDSFVDINNWQVATPHEIAYGLFEVRTLREDKEFSDDVIAYIRGSCAEWGLIIAHDTFKAAQDSYTKDSLPARILQDITSGEKKMKESKWQLDLLSSIDEFIKDKKSLKPVLETV